MSETTKFSCVFCTDSFDSKESLQVHFRKHGDPNQHRIIKNSKKPTLNCPVLTPSVAKTVVDNEMVSCDVCPEVFPTISKAITHKHKMHPEYDGKHFCPWCGKHFTMKHLYDKHLSSHDVDTQPEEVFPCDICSVKFYVFAAMQYHNKFCHRQDTDLPSIGHSKKHKLVNEKLAEMYYCTFCGDEYMNKVNLHKHMSDNHNDEDQSPEEVLRCPLCEAIFYHIDAYKTHLTFHSVGDVYCNVNEDTIKNDISEFTLETVPPIKEKVENYFEPNENTESDISSMGIDQFLQLAMDTPMETDQDDIDNDTIPTTSEKRKSKKHKKHKKSKKSAITLDEFLNMNKDVFGEGLDFEGVEEIPTQVVAKQFKKVKKDSSTNMIGSATKISAANLEKLRQQGLVVKTKHIQNKPGMKAASEMRIPVKIATNAVIQTKSTQPIKVSNETLSKLMSQTNNQLKIVKTSVPGNIVEKPTDTILQNTGSDINIKAIQSDKQSEESPFSDVRKEEMKIASNSPCDDNNSDEEYPLHANLNEKNANESYINNEIKENSIQCIKTETQKIVKNNNENNMLLNKAELTIKQVSTVKIKNAPGVSKSEHIIEQNKIEIPTISSDNSDDEDPNANDFIGPNNDSSNESKLKLLTNSQITIKSLNSINVKNDVKKSSNVLSTNTYCVENSVKTNTDNSCGDIIKADIKECEEHIIDSPKNKLLANSELTIKPMKTHSINKIIKTVNNNERIENKDIKKVSTDNVQLSTQEIKNKQLPTSNVKLLNSELRIKSNVPKQVINDIKVKSIKTKYMPIHKEKINNETYSESDENIDDFFDSDSSDDRNHDTNAGHIHNKNSLQPKSKINNESFNNATDKFLNNSELSVKSVTKMQIKKPNIIVANQNGKNTCQIETIEDDSCDENEYITEPLQQAKNMNNQNRLLIHKQPTKTRYDENKFNIINSINNLKNINGITVKTGNSLTKYTQNDSDSEDLQDDHIENVDDDSYEENDDCENSKSQILNDPNKQINKMLTENKLSQLKNVVSVDTTLKCKDNMYKEEENIITDDDDNNDIDLEHLTSSDEAYNEDTIVEKLRNSNQGLLIKSIKTSKNDNSGTLQSNVSRQSESQVKSLKRDSNVLQNNREISMTPPKQIKSARQINNPIQQQSQKNNKDALTKKNNQIKHVNQDISGSSVNKEKTVSQEVTVKTIQTKTVFQEITTTVTKTIRTVNQTMNSEVVRASLNQNVEAISSNSNVKGQRIVQTTKGNPQLAKNITQGIPIRHNVTNQSQIIKPNIKNTYNINKNVPINRHMPIKKPHIIQQSTPLKETVPVMKKVIGPAQSNPIGKVLKLSPNVIKGPTRIMNKETSSPASPGPFSCFKKPKESLIPVNEMSEASTARTSSEKKIYMASQLSKSNFSNTTKTMKSNSIMSSAHLKTEFKSSTSSNISQQLNKLSNTSGLKIVRSNRAQQEHTQIESCVENKSNNSTLIEKLQKQGLLIKKPRLDLNLDDESDSNNEYDSDPENQCLAIESGG